MRNVKLYIATSLDGKIARNDHGLDWLPEIEEDGYGYDELMASIDTLLMGYTTYEVCAGLGEWPYNGKTTYVFSRNAARPVTKKVTLKTDDPVAFTKQLKEQPGKDIWLVGGGDIICQLHDADLIDEYIITTIPVLLGKGIELFPNLNREQSLRLNKHKVYDSGLSLMYYTRKTT